MKEFGFKKFASESKLIIKDFTTPNKRDEPGLVIAFVRVLT